jgi:hypothetical protein
MRFAESVTRKRVQGCFRMSSRLIDICYLVLEEGPSGGGVRWYKDRKALDQHLDDEPVSLIINVKQISQRVQSRVRELLATDSPA